MLPPLTGAAGVPDLSSSRLRAFVPPAARHVANRLVGALIRYRGPYADWNAALAATAGYDSADILDRVAHATELVLRGEATYEQDGIAQHDVPGPSHALSALLLAAALDQGTLSVVDYGGGLGSHYLRWRPWLARLGTLHWHVVEQSSFVAAGQSLFAEDASISFATGVDRGSKPTPNVVLASSVLQYLPQPMEVLEELLSLEARIVIIDRTPFSRDDRRYVCSQHVPRRMGSASYPLWVLSRDEIHARLYEQYDLLQQFPSPDAAIGTGRIQADYVGSIWMRRMVGR